VRELALHSMTGFGRAGGSGEAPFWVEVRSVNHRYLDLSIRLPHGLAGLEPAVRERVASYLTRGRVEVTVVAKPQADETTSRTVSVNHELLQAYLEAAREAAAIWGGPGPSLEFVLQQPGVLVVEEAAPDLERLWASLSPVLDEALEQLVAMRRTEGERLAQDLRQRLARVSALVNQMAEAAPRMVAQYRSRLSERVEGLIQRGDLDPGRLEAEVLLFAERVDISEELVRARSHLVEFERTLGQGGPVGRRLDFLLQELLRETNTVGSKAQDGQIASWVVDVKTELERMREQVQNLE